jgi:DNA (cytosine-5)-methyltransferase 1
MGFSDDFKLIGSKAKLYNRIGNSIVISMVEEIAKEVKVQILESDDVVNQSFKVLKQTSLFDLNNGLSQQLVG